MCEGKTITDFYVGGCEGVIEFSDGSKIKIVLEYDNYGQGSPEAYMKAIEIPSQSDMDNFIFDAKEWLKKHPKINTRTFRAIWGRDVQVHRGQVTNDVKKHVRMLELL